MTLFLAILLTTFARAAEPPAEPHVKVRSLRLVSGFTFRQHVSTGAWFETGVRVVGKRGLHVELGAAFVPLHLFTLAGPRRSMMTIDALVDVDVDLGPYLTTGPTVGLAFRLFDQQGLLIDDSQTGLVGWTVRMTMLRTRAFELTLNGRALTDLRPTDLVLATSQVQRLPRTEARFGIGVAFGHGRFE